MPRSRSSSPVRRVATSKSDLHNRLENQCQLACEIHSSLLTYSAVLVREQKLKTHLDEILTDCRALLNRQPTQHKPSELLLATDEIITRLLQLAQPIANKPLPLLIRLLSKDQLIKLRLLEQTPKPKTATARQRLYSSLDEPHHQMPLVAIVVTMIVGPTDDWLSLHC